MEDEYPRAFCHEDEVEALIMKWEQKHSTPINQDEIAEIMMSVHADHEDCECDCCLSC